MKRIVLQRRPKQEGPDAFYAKQEVPDACYALGWCRRASRGLIVTFGWGLLESMKLKWGVAWEVLLLMSRLWGVVGGYPKKSILFGSRG
jgi:hypothetical protein